MKMTESREHELLSLNPTRLEPANEALYHPDPLQLDDILKRDRAPDAALAGICGAYGTTNAASPSGGWSPYEVWRTRVSRLARARDPRQLP